LTLPGSVAGTVAPSVGALSAALDVVSVGWSRALEAELRSHNRAVRMAALGFKRSRGEQRTLVLWKAWVGYPSEAVLCCEGAQREVRAGVWFNYKLYAKDGFTLAN